MLGVGLLVGWVETAFFWGATPEEAIDAFERQLEWYNGGKDTPDEIVTELGTFRRNSPAQTMWVLYRNGVEAVLYMNLEPDTLDRYWVFGFRGAVHAVEDQHRGQTPGDAIDAVRHLMEPYVAMVDNFRALDIPSGVERAPVEGSPWYDRL